MNRRFAWPALGLLVYLALYFAFLFRPYLLRIDDFGYLQSVLDTLSFHRLRTHDWLGPYNAPWTALGALIFRATGNFTLATWGLLPVFSALNLLLIHLLLRRRLPPREALCLAFVIATQPMFWYKSAEYAGNVPALTFVLASLLAYTRGSWLDFFLSAFLAFATRQNNIALLALPAWHLARGNTPGTPPKWLLPAGLGAFAAAALALHHHLNRTIAQTEDVFHGFGPTRALAILRAVCIGFAVAIALLSLLDAALGASLRDRFRENLRKPWPWAAGALFIALLVIPREPYISFLTPLVGSLDRSFALQWLLCAVVPASFFLFDWTFLRPDARGFLVAAYVGISALRGFWYDFYLIEIAVAALFLFLHRRPEPVPRPQAAVALAILLCAHLGWAYLFRIHSDKQWTNMQAYEMLERSGRIHADDMTDGTFGFLGWKLFDHFARTEKHDRLENFQCYVRRDRVVVETELPWRRSFKRAAPRTEGPSAAVLDQGFTSIGFFRVRYRVLGLYADADPICVSGYLPLDRGAYKVKPVPLDGQEWDALARERLKTRAGP